MNNPFGLRSDDIAAMIAIVAQQPEIEQALIFGSRAKGNYKNGSDVDIALKGQNFNLEIVNRVGYQLNEETIMPYKFDVLHYQTVNNSALIEHIDQVGIEFYRKQLSPTNH
jgi:predicted nucleotidyltransferase